MGKYDLIDQPLNIEIALKAIRTFTDKIDECFFVDIESAYDSMDKTKSIGFGATNCGVFSRADPLMKDYLYDFVKQSQIETKHILITASQKDEVRVSTKTPRLFTSYPPEHTFLATIVLGDFFRQFCDHRFTIDGTPSAVGDPMQLGALAEYYHQMSKHKYSYATDTSAQDSSVSAEFIHMVYDEIKSKYDLDSDENNMFETVRFNSIYKYMNINGDVYLVPRGLGSGDYLTIIINIMWRYYMVLENYNHNLDLFEKENTVVINGDDLIMSSDYGDLDLNSKHAKIEWANTHIPWEEMEFCSLKFKPFIHHDPKKVRAVLNLRRKRKHMLEPACELQRLGGLLRTLSTREVYDEILHKMITIVLEDRDLFDLFESLIVDYEVIFDQYNNTFLFT